MATFKGTTYYRPDSLLTVENAKTTKGESLGMVIFGVGVLAMFVATIIAFAAGAR
jgi:hypothetical protein